MRMRKKYEDRICIWLNIDMKKKIQDIADGEGRNVSEIIRELIVEYVDKKESKSSDKKERY